MKLPLQLARDKEKSERTDKTKENAFALHQPVVVKGKRHCGIIGRTESSAVMK